MRRRPRTRRLHSTFFFNDTATTEIYTLSLHDALPILPDGPAPYACPAVTQSDEFITPDARVFSCSEQPLVEDRKSTRLNSSHANISYAVFCLKTYEHHTRHHLCWRVLLATPLALMLVR